MLGVFLGLIFVEQGNDLAHHPVNWLALVADRLSDRDDPDAVLGQLSKIELLFERLAKEPAVTVDEDQIERVLPVAGTFDHLLEDWPAVITSGSAAFDELRIYDTALGAAPRQAMGALVPVVNLEGIKPGELVFSGELLGDIYLGKVKTWNDPAIAKLNPKLKLTSDAITVVRRSDGSGTTFLWTDYLSKANAEWKAKAGTGTAVEWPTGVGAKGNEGVAGNVSQTKNSIGYVEYAYAKQNKLTHAAVINKAGKTIQPTIEAFQAAAANADWANSKNYYLILTDQPGDASWPITGATFIIMHKDPVDKAAAKEAIKFFKWAFEKGDKMAQELDYIPMPDTVVKQIEKTWSADIKS